MVHAPANVATGRNFALHSSVEDLKRYALGQLPAGEAAAIETHLMECLSCGKAFSELASGPKDLPLEQRREVRVTLDSPARIKALDPLTSLGPSATGQILNTSISGLKLKVPRAFVPGAVVQIRFQGQIVLGTVRYCIPLKNEFLVGVHLKEEL